MNPPLIAILFCLSLLPAAASAQSAPQTAAVETTVPAATATPSAAAGPGNITRQQYQERASQRAASRFDQIDANHDGVLDRDEIRAWRSQHSRRAHPQASQPAPQ
jgi:phosphate-selective porin